MRGSQGKCGHSRPNSSRPLRLRALPIVIRSRLPWLPICATPARGMHGRAGSPACAAGQRDAHCLHDALLPFCPHHQLHRPAVGWAGNEVAVNRVGERPVAQYRMGVSQPAPGILTGAYCVRFTGADQHGAVDERRRSIRCACQVQEPAAGARRELRLQLECGAGRWHAWPLAPLVRR